MEERMYDLRLRQTGTPVRLGTIVFRDGAPPDVWQARKERAFQVEILSREVR